MSNQIYVKGIAISLLLIGLIVLYVFEFDYFSRTLHSDRLVKGALLAGALLGAGLAYRFMGARDGDLVDRVQYFLFFITLCAMFMPLFASLSNRLLSWRPARPVRVEFVEESERYASAYGAVRGNKVSSNQFWLFFYHRDRLYRVREDTLHFKGHERGDTIEVFMKKGLWGLEVVTPAPANKNE